MTAARAFVRYSTNSQRNRSARSELIRRNSKNIWVGSGESWTRNSVSIGDGIYKSSDGGETWTNAGLPKSERHRPNLSFSPKTATTVFASVPGALWSDSADRGLYRTTDGGKNWELALKGSNSSTGCSTVAIDPKDPNVMFAALWDFGVKAGLSVPGRQFRMRRRGADCSVRTMAAILGTRSTAENSKGFPKKPYGRSRLRSHHRIRNGFTLLLNQPTARFSVSDDGGSTWISATKVSGWFGEPFSSPI